MKIVYAPVLFLIAVYEAKYPPCSLLSLSLRLSFSPFQADGRVQAGMISKNRMEGVDDEDGVLGWDLPDLGEPWVSRVKASIPKIEEDEMSLLYQIKDDIQGKSDGHGSPDSAPIST